MTSHQIPPSRWILKRYPNIGDVVTLTGGDKVRILIMLDDDGEVTEDPIAAIDYVGYGELLVNEFRLNQLYFSISDIAVPV